MKISPLIVEFDTIEQDDFEMIHRLAFVFGTRPEAIKLAPLINRIKRRKYSLTALTIFTGQHRGIAKNVLSNLSITPDYSLGTMTSNQQLPNVMAKLLVKLTPLFVREHIDIVVVQGDTTTTITGALAAFYKRIPVAHVEAGLRTWDKLNPYPEEVNRSLTTLLTDYHFAPTRIAKQNLLKAGVRRNQIFVTGNTVVDALKEYTQFSKTIDLPVLNCISPNQRIILVTIHRRESFGKPLLRICQAIKIMIQNSLDIDIIIPVHPNPNVKNVLRREIHSLHRVHLIAPVDYLSFLQLLQKCDIILTDSGGIIEEAPSFGKPVLILRDITERPEAVQKGLAFLVGTQTTTIVRETFRLLKGHRRFNKSNAGKNPFGDGSASDRILRILSSINISKTTPYGTHHRKRLVRFRG